MVVSSFALGYSGATVSVTDIATSDVSGLASPIRAFPVPAATGWSGANLIYDNYAEGLGFSASWSYNDFNWVDFPLGNANVTIQSVDYTDTSWNNVVVDGVNNGLSYFTNEEGDAGDLGADPRYPYNIPRPGRYCGEDFTAVEFLLTEATTQFGVFLPSHSNTWSSDPANSLDDHNYQQVLLDHLDVFILGEADTYATAQHIQDIALGGYSPFLMVEDNDVDLIKSVVVVHNAAAWGGPTVGFMDVYSAVPEPATLALLAMGGVVAAIGRRG
jgi:hypothetical protein